jgi:hypothetical protein
MIAALGLLALARAVPDDSPFTATSIPWRAGGPTKIHGATVDATATAVLNLTHRSEPFDLLTNRRRGFDFAPATRVTLARCILPAALGPHGRRGRARRIACLPDDGAPRAGPCVLAQDHFLPFTFQHAVINSVPTRGVAALVQKYLVPEATLVVESPRATHRAAHEGDLRPWRATRCGLSADGATREWIFVGEGGASVDCYPRGAFDWFRRRDAATEPGDLLVYASRDDSAERRTTGDAGRLEAWLEALAPRLRLSYVKLAAYDPPGRMRTTFRRARLVVGPHGGALANLAYAHASTTVLEIGGGINARLCFACMAYAMRFPRYAIYNVRGFRYGSHRDPLPSRHDHVTRVPQPVDVEAVARFFEGRVLRKSLPGDE